MGFKAIDLANNVAATAGDKSSVNVGKVTPFLPGRKVQAHIQTEGASGTAPVYAIDGSEDDTTFVELGTSIVVGHSVIEVPAYPYMRLSVTTAAGTAGTISAWLEGNG
jgi:hypothetical protein